MPLCPDRSCGPMYRGSKNNPCSAAVGSLINTSHSRSLESTSDHLCEEAPRAVL